jgi:predicted metal-dependent hydrolase
LPELEERLSKEEEEERSNNSVSPSQLHAENLERARGAFRIHDRDSGVARHSLFYEMVQYLNDKTDSVLEVREDEWKKLASSVEALGYEWKKLANSITALADVNRSHSTGETKDIQGREAYYSEGLARCLTKFSFQNHLPFLFSHQLACKATAQKEDTADVAVFYAGTGVDRLLGLVEVKESSDDKAKWQLCGYLSEAFESKLFVREQCISFGLTIDQYRINLYGFRWDQQERPLLEHSLLWSAGLTEAINDGGKIFKAYFQCLAALSNPEVREAPPSNDYCPLVDDQVINNSPKVFHNKTRNTMYKLFDYGNHRNKTRQPNKHVIEAAYSEEDSPMVVDVQEDKLCVVAVLTTPWFKGNHEPTCPEHIAKICDQLQLLHNNGMHHNDVLCQNVIFGFQGYDGSKPSAHLIDFDYAHLEVYPEFWNTRFPERHPKSRAWEETRASHDVYAAIAILCNFFKGSNDGQTLCDIFANGPFTKDEHPKLKPGWEKASAATVGCWIRDNAESLVLKSQSTHEQMSSVTQQTGSPPEKKGRR